MNLMNELGTGVDNPYGLSEDEHTCLHDVTITLKRGQQLQNFSRVN